METAILKELLKQGVVALFTVVFIWLYIRQLKRTEALADKLFEAFQAMVKSDTEVKNVLAQVAHDVDGIREDLRDHG